MEKNPTQTQQHTKQKTLTDELLEILRNSCYYSILQKRTKKHKSICTYQAVRKYSDFYQ